MFVVAVVGAVTTPWLPYQSISVAGGVPIQGYVLGTQGDQTAVYAPSSKRVIFVNSISLTHQLCELSPDRWALSSIAQILLAHGYPTCPSK